VNDAELGTPSVDPISDILKWILLVVAVICFGMLGWATVRTYEKAPPHPLAFIDPAGNVLMTDDDIVAGKGGFQKADLMDYGTSTAWVRTSARITRPRPSSDWVC
jgi:nitric oxide reductase subunit B